MIEIKSKKIDGLVEIIPRKFSDERGFFSETYNAARLREHGINIDFVQDNSSLSRDKGVLRGLHYQLPPFAQDKLVRVLRGRVLDVAVDIRKGSPTFGQWVSVELDSEKWNQFLVPKGFAHGFVTLEDNTEFFYKVSNYYSAEHDRAIKYDDPKIGIDWQIDPATITTSQKDAAAPLLSDAEITFTFVTDASE